MFCITRDTAISMAVVISLAVSFYLYKEMKRTSDEILKIKSMGGGGVRDSSFTQPQAPVYDVNNVSSRKQSQTVVIKKEPEIVEVLDEE